MNPRKLRGETACKEWLRPMWNMGHTPPARSHARRNRMTNDAAIYVVRDHTKGLRADTAGLPKSKTRAGVEASIQRAPIPKTWISLPPRLKVLCFFNKAT